MLVRAPESLELEFQGIVSHPVWMLETELGSSGKAASALKHQAIPLVPVRGFLHQLVIVFQIMLTSITSPGQEECMLPHLFLQLEDLESLHKNLYYENGYNTKSYLCI